ncbi:Oleate activated transcription factor [Dirofilaria immitis]
MVDYNNQKPKVIDTISQRKVREEEAIWIDKITKYGISKGVAWVVNGKSKFGCWEFNDYLITLKIWMIQIIWNYCNIHQRGSGNRAMVRDGKMKISDRLLARIIQYAS